jgi:uncharacterized protein YndB with AHSA1/START domain
MTTGPMGVTDDVKAEDELVFECELDAPPDKVWRAVTIPAFRERWLPEADLADPEPVTAVPGREVRYRLRDDEPPFESHVTFELLPNGAGGTHFRIVHRLPAARPLPLAANSNTRLMMRAA